MEEYKDIRWKQRFSNYKKALAKFTAGIELLRRSDTFADDVSELLQEGLIQRFEYTLELAWNVMKDYEQEQGVTDVTGSKSAMRRALAMGIIDSPDWMETIKDRNLSTHDYDHETANNIREKIINVYYPLFVDFEKAMEAKANENED